MESNCKSCLRNDTLFKHSIQAETILDYFIKVDLYIKNNNHDELKVLNEKIHLNIYSSNHYCLSRLLNEKTHLNIERLPLPESTKEKLLKYFETQINGSS